jgi:NAD(P)-dependent dehydrogenase (short-subunit alcohol dehydrogenase family)
VMSRLSGKTAVVTGASKGIGGGIAKGLAAEGAAVVVNYASSKAGADRVVADIKDERLAEARPEVVSANARTRPPRKARSTP